MKYEIVVVDADAERWEPVRDAIELADGRLCSETFAGGVLFRQPGRWRAVGGPGHGDFSIGSDVWPGTSKLIEETGELQQILGKLIASHGDPAHWSGDLRAKLVEEIGDVRAALEFFIETNMLADEALAIGERENQKFVLFHKWHSEQGHSSARHEEVTRQATGQRRCQSKPFGSGPLPQCEQEEGHFGMHRFSNEVWG